MKMLTSEIAIHKKLKHANIVRFYTDLEDRKYKYLVMEYISEKNLFKRIPKNTGFDEHDTFWYWIQTVQGIYFMHKHRIIHRDLKPENLLVDKQNMIKICDFGWTCEIVADVDSDGQEVVEDRNTFCGTLAYMAPEMMHKRPHGHEVDIWALGILRYELVHGVEPFQGKGASQISSAQK